MKQLIFLLLLTQLIFSQERKYHFEYVENRISNGWERIEIQGDVIFYEDKHSHTVTIITDSNFEHFYVISKQLFIRQYTYVYILEDEYYNKYKLRVNIIGSLNTLELYYYSEMLENICYRLKLKKCD